MFQYYLCVDDQFCFKPVCFGIKYFSIGEKLGQPKTFSIDHVKQLSSTRTFFSLLPTILLEAYQLPTSFGNLSSKAYLVLMRNNFEGSIPNKLGQLTNLN
jgi:hypothetical protein